MSDKNLTAASNQWMTRPADERFWTLGDMRQACETHRAASRTFADVNMRALRANAIDGDMWLTQAKSNGGTASARYTNHSFGQFARAAGAPPSYLRELPAHLAAECVNASAVRTIALNPEVSGRNLLIRNNGEGVTLRAMATSSYARVWDAEVVEALERLQGWRTPAGRVPPGYRGATRAATEADILPGQIWISPGTAIAPSGLYASDHDMFAFLVAPDRVIDDGTGKPLMRGIFVRNSEVGEASLSFTFFLMQAVCGNHIVWGASGVHEIRIRHVGRDPFAKAMRGFQAILKRYDDAAPEEERMIVAARELVLGNSKKEVLDALVKYANSHSIPISGARFDRALDVAAEHEDWYGNPRTLWAAVAGLTHDSQGGTFADTRNEADRNAGKLLAMVAPQQKNAVEMIG
jgi:hypothetical protein